jgi:hypothetical protein
VVQGTGFRFSVFGFRGLDSGIRFQGLGSGMWNLRFTVKGLGLGLGVRV